MGRGREHVVYVEVHRNKSWKNDQLLRTYTDKYRTEWGSDEPICNIVG